MLSADSRTPATAGHMLPRSALALVAVALVTPLLVAPSTFVFPYVTPKVLFLRSVALLLGGILLLAVPGLRLRLTPITAAVSLFGVSAALSTFVAVDVQRSIWDTPERMLGLFTLAHYGLFYLAAAVLVRDRSAWRLLLRVFLAVSAVVVGLGVGQRVIPDFLYHQGDPRVSATLGHPIYLGGLGVTTAFAGGVRWAMGGRTRGIEAALAGLIGLVGIGTAASRGSVLALAAGLCVLGLGVLAARPRRSRARRLAGALVLVVLAGGATLFVLRHRPGFEQVPGLRRFAGVTLESPSVRPRLLAWAIAADAFKERPLLGWGPANFYYAFNRHYRPRLYEFGREETWFDSAHNAVLDALVQQGAVGCLAYLALLAVPPVVLWKANRRGQVPASVPCAATALLAAHGVHAAFVFEEPTSYLHLAFFLAFFNRCSEGFEARPGTAWPMLRPMRAAAVLVVAVGMIWATNVNPARANHLGRQAILAAATGRPEEGRVAWERCAAAGGPHIDGLRELFAVAVVQRLTALPEAARSLQYQELGRLAYGELGKARLRRPFDVRLALHRGRLAHVLAGRFGDRDVLAATAAELEVSRTLSPQRQEIGFVLSTTRVMLGDPHAAIHLLQAAIAAAPRVAEGWWRLALVYRAAGRDEEARQILREAARRGVRFTASEEDWIRGMLPY